MKRVINIMIVAISASVMVACNNTNTNVSRITKGDKTKFDSLSYCVGFSNTIQFCSGMPDVRLDWNKVIDVCSEMLLVPIGEEVNDRHEEVSDMCVVFFDSIRVTRLKKIQAEKEAADPDKKFDISAALDTIDIFESPEERERISWALGYDMGYNFRKMPYHIQVHWFKQGMLDGTNLQNASKVSQIQAYMTNYHEVIWPLINAEASAKWLSQVSKELNVKQTPSGLMYRISEMGDENLKPNPYARVKVDYETICHDGHKFASTYRTGKPVELQLERIIKGWAEGMQLIGKGGKITLWIPAELAYGERGNNFVGPNEALQFNIEILEVDNPNVQVQKGDLGPAPTNKKKQKNGSK